MSEFQIRETMWRTCGYKPSFVRIHRDGTKYSQRATCYAFLTFNTANEAKLVVECWRGKNAGLSVKPLHVELATPRMNTMFQAMCSITYIWSCTVGHMLLSLSGDQPNGSFGSQGLSCNNHRRGSTCVQVISEL